MVTPGFSAKLRVAAFCWDIFDRVAGSVLTLTFNRDLKESIFPSGFLTKYLLRESGFMRSTRSV